MRKGSLVPCFYGRTLSCTVPAACTSLPCFKMVKSLAQAKSLASAWNFTDFSQTIAVSISAYRCLIKNSKNMNDRPVSAIILMTSKLEAILKICRCSLKLVKSSVGGGELSSAPLRLSGAQVQQVASGYARLVTPFHRSISVSFSFFTFLCFAASWTGVDKKYSHYLCRTI